MEIFLDILYISDSYLCRIGIFQIPQCKFLQEKNIATAIFQKYSFIEVVFTSFISKF